MISHHIDPYKRDLIREMDDHKLEPDVELIIDGEPHEYHAYMDGRDIPAIYSAHLYPLKDDPNGPILTCLYRTQTGEKEYFYSSSKKKQK
jgi:hypothetical protein